MENLILMTIAYLLGSIPTAVWLSKFVYNKDIREFGSGNAGATNTFRVLGKGPGVFVMIVDMLKGFIAVKLAYLSHYTFNSEMFVSLQVFLGIAAVLGHIFPIYAGFRGGKGIATLFGMILGIQYIIAVLLIGVFIVILLLTRYVSLSSILASIALPILVLYTYNEPELSYRIFSISVAFLVLLTHHKNIGRLLEGNESKINIKAKKRS